MQQNVDTLTWNSDGTYSENSDYLKECKAEEIAMDQQANVLSLSASFISWDTLGL